MKLLAILLSPKVWGKRLVMPRRWKSKTLIDFVILKNPVIPAKAGIQLIEKFLRGGSTLRFCPLRGIFVWLDSRFRGNDELLCKWMIRTERYFRQDFAVFNCVLM